MEKKCKSCGNKMDIRALICPHCGEKSALAAISNSKPDNPVNHYEPKTTTTEAIDDIDIDEILKNLRTTVNEKLDKKYSDKISEIESKSFAVENTPDNSKPDTEQSVAADISEITVELDKDEAISPLYEESQEDEPVISLHEESNEDDFEDYLYSPPDMDDISSHISNEDIPDEIRISKREILDQKRQYRKQIKLEKREEKERLKEARRIARNERKEDKLKKRAEKKDRKESRINDDRTLDKHKTGNITTTDSLNDEYEILVNEDGYYTGYIPPDLAKAIQKKPMISKKVLIITLISLILFSGIYAAWAYYVKVTSFY